MQDPWGYLRALGRPPIQFPIQFLLNEGWCWGSLCVLAEVTEVHVTDIVVGVDFDGNDFRIFCSNFCGCGRFMKE